MFGEIEGTGFEMLDPRFGSCFVGHARVERLWTGGRWREGPAWLPPGRYLVWSDIPNNRMMRFDETAGVGLGVPPAFEQFQRQYGRRPGPARHLRAPDTAGDAHRTSTAR